MPDGGDIPTDAELKQLSVDLKKATDEVKSFAEKATTEIKNLGDMSKESKIAADKALTEMNAVAARVANIPPKPSEDPAIEAELKKNYQLAGQLGATGTPLFVVGDRVLSGAVGYDALKKAIEDAEKKG